MAKRKVANKALCFFFKTGSSFPVVLSAIVYHKDFRFAKQLGAEGGESCAHHYPEKRVKVLQGKR